VKPHTQQPAALTPHSRPSGWSAVVDDYDRGRARRSPAALPRLRRRP
jgi:hypothetical protein